MGEPGSEAHVRRERLLRASISLRERLSAAAARVEAARPALDAAADADPALNPSPDGPNPARGSSAAAAAGPSRAADAQMALLFGDSSDESDTEGACEGFGRVSASAPQAPRAAAGRSGAAAAGGQLWERTPQRRSSPTGARVRARVRAVPTGPPAPVFDPTERPRAALGHACMAAEAAVAAAAAAVSPGGTPRAASPVSTLTLGSRRAAAAAAGALGVAAAGAVAVPADVKRKLLQDVRA